MNTEKIREFCARNHICKLSLFGSVLHKVDKPGSDVDILVEFLPGHEPGWDFFDMEAELSAIIGRKVDLNTPNFLSRYFRDEVVREAVVCHGK